jgi:putative ABC transport system permease protein
MGDIDMDELKRDLRLAFRSMRRRPGFTLVTVLSLALGIGANTAVFSIINSLMLSPLPIENDKQLVRLRDSIKQGDRPARTTSMSVENYLALEQQTTVFTGLAAHEYTSFNFFGGEEPERIQGSLVTASSMPLLGVEPILGRGIRPDEDRPGAPESVVVISHDLWQSHFGGGEEVLGTAVTLDDQAYTVIGVMPRGYKFPYDSELWLPMGVTPDNTRALRHFLHVVARIEPGVTAARVESELGTLGARLEQERLDTNSGWGFAVQPLREDITDDVQPKLLFVLMGASAFLLLIACTNVATMLLARSLEQSSEIAVRMALGGTRVRLIRQLVTQGLVLGLVSGAIGLLLALWSYGPLVAMSPLSGMSIFFQQLSLDLRVLGFAFVISLLVGVGFSLVPALRVSRLELHNHLKEGGRALASRGRRRLLSSLVVGQVAVAVVLLVGAGLMVRSFKRLQQVESGFETDNRLTLKLSLSETKYPEDHQRVAFLREVLERVEALPGITSVDLTTTHPLDDARMAARYSVESRPPADPSDRSVTNDRLVSPGYFRTMGIGLLEGRGFSEQDRDDGLPVVVISKTFADANWQSESPLGRQVKVGDYDEDNPWMTIVGVADDVIDRGDFEETWYLPYTQRGFTRDIVTLVVRAETDPASLIGAIRSAIHELDKTQPVFEVATHAEMLADSRREQRFSTLLFGLFAALGLIVAVMGIYGIQSYSVVQRSREVGVRMAMGAEPRDVLQLVLRQGLRLAIVGLAVGLVGALGLTRFLASLLFEITPTDPATFLLIAVSTVLVALLASVIPAYRAARVDPMEVLRYE